MIDPIPFDPARFRSAAQHYLRGRPDYAPSLIEDVALLCGLDGTGRLLDLGCGPGQLARAFRPHMAAAEGWDPDPEMLALAAEITAQAGMDVSYRCAASHDVDPAGPALRMVTIGRAFHWMDRTETLRRLDSLVEPGGAVVLFRVDHLDVPDNAWRAPLEAAQARAVGGIRAAWRQPGWVRHEAFLLDSAFSDVRRVGTIERRQIPADSLVHRALSMSSTTRAKLGDAGAAALQAEAEAIAAAHAVHGLITEVVEPSALIARRPARNT